MELLVGLSCLFFARGDTLVPTTFPKTHQEQFDGAVTYWRDGKQIMDVYTPKCIHRFQGVNLSYDGDEMEGDFDLPFVLGFHNYPALEIYYSSCESIIEVPYPTYPEGRNLDFNTLKITE